MIMKERTYTISTHQIKVFIDAIAALGSLIYAIYLKEEKHALHCVHDVFMNKLMELKRRL